MPATLIVLCPASLSVFRRNYFVKMAPDNLNSVPKKPLKSGFLSDLYVLRGYLPPPTITSKMYFSFFSLSLTLFGTILHPLKEKFSELDKMTAS